MPRRPPDVTPLIARLEAAARAALDRGDREAFEKAAGLVLLAKWAGQEALRPLPHASHSGKDDRMVPAARVRHSQGKGKQGKAVDPLVTAANKGGYTLRSLAEHIGCSHAHLYQARRGTVGMRTAWAREIERLTGFEASKANWPGGLT